MAFDWIVAGLGNPGPEYAVTRHNVGFAVADALADDAGVGFKRAAKHRASIAETPDGVVLAKPQTYMNESGVSLGSLLRYYKVPVERLIVVYDDLDLMFAKIRVRVGGGTGGHNGLRSIVGEIGAEFVRVKIGIGRPPGRMDPAAYVLAPFAKRERDEIDSALVTAAEAVTTIIGEGAEAAQNRYN